MGELSAKRFQNFPFPESMPERLCPPAVASSLGDPSEWKQKCPPNPFPRCFLYRWKMMVHRRPAACRGRWSAIVSPWIYRAVWGSVTRRSQYCLGANWQRGSESVLGRWDVYLRLAFQDRHLCRRREGSISLELASSRIFNYLSRGYLLRSWSGSGQMDGTCLTVELWDFRCCI